MYRVIIFQRANISVNFAHNYRQNEFYHNDLEKLSILVKLRYMLNVKAALDIVKTMFCSIIDYGNIFLSSCNDGDLNYIQTLQNHALRCCCNIKNPMDVHVCE